jgi:hypothetical protein
VDDSSIRAMRGIHQLEIAFPRANDSWALGTGVSFFAADNLAIEGEHHRRVKLRGAFAYSPWSPLDLALVCTSVSDSSHPILPSSTNTAGDPELSAKLAHAFGAELALGVLFQILIPTAWDGSGLAFDATTITGRALATYRPNRALALALDAGYRFDNTRNIFPREFAAGEETLMRFNGNIAQASAVVGGLGAIGHFEAGRQLLAAPFVELVGAVAPSGQFKDNPIAANLGAKALLKRAGLIEVTVGTSLRISGAPSATSKLPGLPPWEVFGQVAFHSEARPQRALASSTREPISCDEQRTCDEHFACVDGTCLPVKEVVREVVKTKVSKTFVINGVINDAATGAPIRGAAVQFSGFENTLLTDGDGAFLSWPFVADDGLLQISAMAAGFRQASQTLAKGPAGETKTVAIKLMPLGKQVTGHIRGSLRDRGSGLPTVGTITIPTTGQKVHANAEGAFAIELPAGSHQLLITAPSMKPQEKQISIGPGEVVILNIDMTPRRR